MMARILVADDDEDVRKAIRKVLVAAGHTVEEAGDSRAALDLYERYPDSLLLIDLYMPGMDGLEAIIRLRTQRPDAKIVAISGGGYRDKHDVLTMALKAGASAILAKPFERADLLSTISAVLGTTEGAAFPGAEPPPPPPPGPARSWLGNLLRRVVHPRR